MTTSSALDIYNAALSACHAKGRLSSIDENSREREECDIWYDLVITTVQEAAFWPSSREVRYLSLLSERTSGSAWVETDPMPQYSYKYALPTNCLRPWHLTDYQRFSLSYDSTTQSTVLHTNRKNAALVYARKQELVTLWTPQQRMATIYGLAAHIAGPITGRGELVQKNISLANAILETAQSSAAEHEDFQMDTIPGPIMARGFAGGLNSPRYYYPHGGFFGASVTTND